MADKYPNFEALARDERAGIDFSIQARSALPAFAIVAPHGGGIEPGTSEIADAIAAEDLSFYMFEGLKPAGNADLHITSTRFDEPLCLTLIRRSEIVLTIHGEESDTGDEIVFIGGLDDRLRRRVGTALRARDFITRKHPDPKLQGLEPENLCNRGRSGKGVQLELSLGARKRMFRSLTRKGRRFRTARFNAFVEAIREVAGN
ncbi:MAG TPA: poly-gamma-glutamate hydrolase family protein [Bryobacteraceae bacterium]|nr:poly-gamma-glutamate hydrolase family protein [Bryobacteraceae bacterium]